MSKNTTVVVNVLSAAVITELLITENCDSLFCIYLLTQSVPTRGLQQIKRICQVCLMGTVSTIYTLLQKNKQLLSLQS